MKTTIYDYVPVAREFVLQNKYLKNIYNIADNLPTNYRSLVYDALDELPGLSMIEHWNIENARTSLERIINSVDFGDSIYDVQDINQLLCDMQELSREADEFANYSQIARRVIREDCKVDAFERIKFQLDNVGFLNECDFEEFLEPLE